MLINVIFKWFGLERFKEHKGNQGITNTNGLELFPAEKIFILKA